MNTTHDPDLVGRIINTITMVSDIREGSGPYGPAMYPYGPARYPEIVAVVRERYGASKAARRVYEKLAALVGTDFGPADVRAALDTFDSPTADAQPELTEEQIAWKEQRAAREAEQLRITEAIARAMDVTGADHAIRYELETRPYVSQLEERVASLEEENAALTAEVMHRIGQVDELLPHARYAAMSLLPVPTARFVGERAIADAQSLFDRIEAGEFGEVTA